LGCFCKIPCTGYFLDLLNYLSTEMVGLVWVIGSFLDARILMKTKGYPRSNLGHRLTNGQPGACLLPRLGSAEAERRGHHGHRLEGDQARATGHQMI
jgi:hypothetical protein